AFLLAFDQDARYDSPNFLWFCARYPSFVTAEAGHERVVCEVNTSPPNPASDAFHAASGFVEVGKASIYDGSRAVRYLSHAL
ncbi:MAG TPA: GNAT family N-acetyltransferase, partial [Bradyrhizobium sp.]|nr:GNAT family N-acetyltransferase [Bradyrhizobium sp.]